MLVHEASMNADICIISFALPRILTYTNEFLFYIPELILRQIPSYIALLILKKGLLLL